MKKYDVYTFWFLSDLGITAAKKYKLEGMQPYVLDGSHLYGFTIHSIYELLEVLIREQPTDITFISGDAYIYRGVNDSVDSREVTLYSSSLTISNINTDAYEWLRDTNTLKSSLNLDVYRGYNPLSDVIKTKAPVFYFKNIAFNENGTAYHEL